MSRDQFLYNEPFFEKTKIQFEIHEKWVPQWTDAN
jgi:hypothetical protein